MLYLGAGFLGFLIGIGIGLEWKDHELNQEIKLRKDWQEIAYKLLGKNPPMKLSEGLLYEHQKN